jgi:hypothetical protein
MPEFNYSASENNGHIVRGRLCAMDRHDLAAQLQARHLFLISGAMVDLASPSSDPAFVPVLPPPAPNVSAARLDDFQSGRMAEPLTSRQRFLLGGILAAGILAGLWRDYERRHPIINNDVVEERLSHIHKGMTRGQVEEYLGKSSIDASNRRLSRYALQPNAIITINYDETGGRFNPENRTTDSTFEIARSAGIP